MDTTRVSIGEFSRMTHLSAKALRLYHRDGILVPAEVDPVSGYRRYGLDQLTAAQVLRRLRALDLPLDEVRAVLTAETVDDRRALLAAHLVRKEAELAQVRDTVDSLRHLLGAGPDDLGTVTVEHRSVPALPVLSVRATIVLADLGPWWTGAFAVLDAAVAEGAVSAVGPRGAEFSTALFSTERGDAVAYRPVTPESVAGVAPPGARFEVLPPVDLAVAVHSGPDADVDRVYGALGEHVTTYAIGVAGPVRETYRVSVLDGPITTPVTEIGWPIFATADRAPRPSRRA